ncbi:MAG: DUF455 family protein [Proteobacteria bacterium]|nr:DUF455 family protein [Pseudomonadota bacterium]
MELSTYALAIVQGDTLDAKLAPPAAALTDRAPGPALRLEAPGRPASLAIRPGRLARVPRAQGMSDPAQRARILHAAANHELQAIELFAWALLAFPDAPPRWRRGLLCILLEEQTHCRRYAERLAAFGLAFGDLPVSGYFWHKTPTLTSPLRFVCAMSLTFESANLDHALDLAARARAAGDETSAQLFERIHHEELRHVRFGWRWLARLKDPTHSMWQAYCAHLTYPVRPAFARGAAFSIEARRRAGLSEDFIAEIGRQSDP